MYGWNQYVRRGKEALRAKPFLRAAGILAGGTALSQLLLVAVLPIITRLYSPGDFNVLAVYMSVLGMFSAAACLRLDIAVPLPASDDDGINLLALALSFSLIVSASLALLVGFFGGYFIALVAQPELKPYLWAIPLGVWLSSSYSAFQNWSGRKKRFATIARTKIFQVASGIVVQLALGMAGIAPLGLILGNMLNGGAGCIGLARTTARIDRSLWAKVNLLQMRRLYQQYDRFPKYATMEALANNAGIQLPLLIIAAVTTGPEAGFLLLATRVIGAPLLLIGTAVSQVYLAHAADEYRQGQLATFTLKTLDGLIRTGVGPLLCAGIAAPVIFPLVFGHEWQRAGYLVSWLTPWYILQFLASPVSMSLHITGHQRRAMWLQLFGFVGRCVGVLAAATLVVDRMGEAYAVVGIVFYLVYLFVIARTLSLRFRELFQIFRRNLYVLGIWVLIGALVAWTLSAFLRGGN